MAPTIIIVLDDRLKFAGPDLSCRGGSRLETLVNLVTAGYGTTLIPQLPPQDFERRGTALRPLTGRSFRTIRLASRPTYPHARGAPGPGEGGS